MEPRVTATTITLQASHGPTAELADNLFAQKGGSYFTDGSIWTRQKAQMVPEFKQSLGRGLQCTVGVLARKGKVGIECAALSMDLMAMVPQLLTAFSGEAPDKCLSLIHFKVNAVTKTL